MLGLKFAFATNGHEIIEFDYCTGLERTLSGCPAPDELWQRYRAANGIKDQQIADRLVRILICLLEIHSELGYRAKKDFHSVTLYFQHMNIIGAHDFHRCERNILEVDKSQTATPLPKWSATASAGNPQDAARNPPSIEPANLATTLSAVTSGGFS